MTGDITGHNMPISCSDVVLLFSVFMTFEAYLYRAHVKEEECIGFDWDRMSEIHDRLGTCMAHCGDANALVSSIHLTKLDASLILFVVRTCYAKMSGDPAGLHVLLDIDDPELLAALADRLDFVIKSFPL